MFITLEPDSEVPLYQQIHDRILEAIASGELKEGDKLDPVRRVATEFGINPATAKKAYDALQADGVIETRGRSGSVIKKRVPTPQQRARLASDALRLATKARAQGFSDADIEAILATLKKGLVQCS